MQIVYVCALPCWHETCNTFYSGHCAANTICYHHQLGNYYLFVKIMDYSSLPLFNVMKSTMGYMSERQSVLAQNVANADTPKYRAKDVVKPDFKKLASTINGGGTQKLHMALTSPMHMGQSSGAISAFKVEKRHTTDELNPDGNNVAIEEEMSKVAANQADYQKVLNLYGKTISLFKTAIGNTGG